jgi:tRNA (guanine37-N1)-methyltransferase
VKINILTGFPDFFSSPLQSSIIRQAQKKELVSFKLLNLRDFSGEKYRSIDDYPFGGGGGMVLKCAPVFAAFEALQAQSPAAEKPVVILPTPQGESLKPELLRFFSMSPEISILAGHYKGVDERIVDQWVTHEVSIGDYIVSSGEIAALVIIDAIVRLIPGVLGNYESAQSDSFEDGLLDCSYYTRPAEFRGLRVPEVLLSGDHEEIENHRLAEKIARTKNRRPDLYRQYAK